MQPHTNVSLLFRLCGKPPRTWAWEYLKLLMARSMFAPDILRQGTSLDNQLGALDLLVINSLHPYQSRRKRPFLC
jgi:hypothetical protein